LSVVAKVVETRGCWGTREVGDVSGEALHDFWSWGQGGFACRTRWGRFFWLVRRRGDGRRGSHTDFERRHAGALVLVLVVACGSADGNGCSAVGVGLDGVAAATGIGVVECIGIAVDGLRGRRGVSDVGSVVEDEGVR